MLRMAVDRAWEQLPEAAPADVTALLTQLGKRGGRADLWSLGRVLDAVKWAFLLRMVQSLEREVKLTEVGRAWLAATESEQQLLIARRLLQLNLFRDLICELHRARSREVEVTVVLRRFDEQFAIDESERLLVNVVRWGRYAGLLDEDPARGKIHLLVG
jgi:hypothetical protein